MMWFLLVLFQMAQTVSSQNGNLFDQAVALLESVEATRVLIISDNENHFHREHSETTRVSVQYFKPADVSAKDTSLSRLSLAFNYFVLDITEGGLVDFVAANADALPSHKHLVIIVRSEIEASGDVFAKFHNAVFLLLHRRSSGSGFDVLERTSFFRNATRKLGSYKDGEWIPSRQDLSKFFTKAKFDFGGEKVKAAAFPFAPYSILNFETRKHSGLEFNIASASISSLGLSLVVSMPSDGKWWGTEAPKGSGTFTGLLGDLQTGAADIGWGNLFAQESRKSFMSFTDWYTVSEVCALVPRPTSYPKVLALVLPFTGYTWLSLALSILGCAVFMLAYSSFYPMTILKPLELFSFLLALVLAQNDFTITRLQSQGIRLAVIGIIVSMFILRIGYGGGLISVLTVNVFPPPPDTFDELYKDVQEKGVEVQACCKNILMGMQDSAIPSLQKMGKLATQATNNLESFQDVSKGGFATFNTKPVLLYSTRKHLTNEIGETNVHIMSECFLPIPIALGLRKHNPLEPLINAKLQRLREAGLINKWIQEGRETAGRLVKTSSGETRKVTPLTMEEIEGPLIVLGVLAGLSCLMFGVELMSRWGKTRVAI